MLKASIGVMIGKFNFWDSTCPIIGEGSEPQDNNKPTEFTIESLFKNGEQGVYYNADKLLDNSMLVDLSGNGNHGVQENEIKRPELIQNGDFKGLRFDGLNTSYYTENIDLTHTNCVTVICIAEKLADLPTYSIIAEFSEVYNNNVGTFALFGTGTETVHTVSLSRNLGEAVSTSARISAPNELIMAGVLEANKLSNFYINGETVQSRTVQEDGNFGNYKLFIGQRNDRSLSFNGVLHSLLIIDRKLTESEIQKVHKELLKV